MGIIKLLRRKAASAYLLDTHGLDRAPGTLAKLAVIGGGPVFRRVGRVPLYSTDDLDEWVASKLSPPMRTTSDTALSKTAVAAANTGRTGKATTAETSTAHEGGRVA